LPVSRQLTEEAGVFWTVVCVPLLMCLFIYLFIYGNNWQNSSPYWLYPGFKYNCYENRIMAEKVGSKMEELSINGK
jgi:hypothetical protein